MLIVERYLLRECVKAWLGVVGVLLVLTLGVGFARFIVRAAAGELPADAVLTIAGFSALENLEIVLPASLLLAVLLTVGRLCQDQEMSALAAGGVGLLRLYRPFLLFAVVLSLLVAWLSLYVAPRAGQAMARLSAQGSVAAQLQAFSAGRFHTLMQGRAAFHAGAADPKTGRMHDIFIRFVDKQGRETVVLAASAVLDRDANSSGQTMILHDGWRYEGRPGQPGFRIIRFGEHGVRISPATAKPDYDLEETTTAALLARDDRSARLEFQRRLAVPVSVLVLALLALPLGNVRPRAGRYGKLVLGVLIYVAYVNGLRLAQVWVQHGLLAPVPALWLVHTAVLAVATVLIARRQGYFMRGPRT